MVKNTASKTHVHATGHDVNMASAYLLASVQQRPCAIVLIHNRDWLGNVVDGNTGSSRNSNQVRCANVLQHLPHCDVSDQLPKYQKVQAMPAEATATTAPTKATA